MASDLYGKKKPAKIKGKEISSSNSLAFSSSLASLISSSTAKAPCKDKPKPSREKPDIFTAHKNAKKRKIHQDENGQAHQTEQEIGSVSAAELQRSKRRMEEKVRLYNAMKRGEYVQRGDGYDDRGLVDFDRKWAEKQLDTDDSCLSDTSDESTGDDGEQVEYLDELGRLRKGSKKQAEKEARESRIQAIAKEEAQQFAARPQMPSNIIHGDAIQHQAYNPDQTIAQQMAELAGKRDKSATPPPDTHFDAHAEVRTKGTGFYTFSQDAEERRKEMEALEQTRRETERVRAENETKKRPYESETQSKSSETQIEATPKSEADRFLDSLECLQADTPAL